MCAGLGFYVLASWQAEMCKKLHLGFRTDCVRNKCRFGWLPLALVVEKIWQETRWNVQQNLADTPLFIPQTKLGGTRHYR